MASGPYRHLQASAVLSGLPDSQLQVLTQATASDLGIDPATFAPAILAYTIVPDAGPQIPITVEIHYSDYRSVSGVQIPFHIERYINGSLQLDVNISSALIN